MVDEGGRGEVAGGAEARPAAATARPAGATHPSVRRLVLPAPRRDYGDSGARAPPAPARQAPLPPTTKKRRRKIVQSTVSGSDRLRIWRRCLLASVLVLYFIV